MTASNDAVGSGSGKPNSRRLPWLLTAAVLMLIYQQVPAPFGVTVIKSWLHYAIWVAGSLLLAQYVRDNAKFARTAAQNITAKLRKLRDGFEFSFTPGRDGQHESTTDDAGDDRDL